jgi:tRNA/tmRNA/rRNA uracil-C5-methylase (TrmA/RlmC/RlmD family)
MSPRDTIVVTPEGWLSRGEAFVSGRGEQLAVFGGIPGEAAKVRIFGRQFSQVRGRAVGPAGPTSEHRQKAPCEKWGPCGGCPWMHLTPEGSAAAHDRLWRDAARDAGIELPIAPVRNGGGTVSEVRVLWGESDRRMPRIGVPAREGAGLVAIPECPKATEELRKFMGAAFASLRLCEIPVGERGPVRGLRVRASRGEIFVTVKAPRAGTFLQDWTLSLASHLPNLRGVVAEIPVEDEPQSITYQRLYGHDHAEIDLAGFVVSAGAEEHLPRDLAGYDAFLREAPGLLGAAEGEAVLDVGAHIGARTLALGRAAGWVLGLESNDHERRRAHHNAQANKVTAEFVGEGWVEALAAVAPRLAGRRPLVWVDCARKELGKQVVEGLRALDPRRVALQGSNPHALAREVARWQNGGWRLTRFERWSVDPHTPFVEAVAILASADDRPSERRAPRRKTLR